MAKTRLELYKSAIRNKNVVKVKFFEMYMTKETLDKECLSLAVESKNDFILNIIARKSKEEYFDRDILKQAFSTNSPSIVKIIAKNSDSSFFDKEMLKEAVNSKNGNVVSEIAKYTKPSYFDREILNKALETKEPDVVRAIVDRIYDMNIFVEYKNKIRAAILSGKDVKNFAAQILSHSDNESFDREMQETVLDIYTDVISKHFKKKDIPVNFPMKEFEDSIKESRYYFSNPNGINFDSLKNKNRFLILPIFATGHAFSAVVRKLDDSEKISVTLVNLGTRPLEIIGKGNQYKEFVYTPENALKILKDHSYNVRLYYPERAVDTIEAYQNFKNKSIESYTVNVTSRDQKVGNCFLKNIEKGVRYALALGLSKANDKNFDPSSLRVTRGSGKKQKVKFLKPIHSPCEKTNDLTTLELRDELIKSLISKFPDYKSEIMEEWKIYKERKVGHLVDARVFIEMLYEKTARYRPVFLGKNNEMNVPKRAFDFNKSKVVQGSTKVLLRTGNNAEFIKKMHDFETKKQSDVSPMQIENINKKGRSMEI